MNNLQDLPELCIPSNYTVIKKNAFFNCVALNHIYTTASEDVDEDAEVFLNADAVDGGPNTYTIASTVTKIEEGAFATRARPITDIYVLALKAPVCEVT